MAKARTPSERSILCTSCGGLLVVAYEAKSVNCHHCHTRVICEALEIKGFVAVRNLRTANSLRLLRKSIVNATLWAEEIEVGGRLTGDVISLGGITVGGRAQVVGNLRACTLAVEEGATLVGEMRIGPQYIPEWRTPDEPLRERAAGESEP